MRLSTLIVTAAVLMNESLISAAPVLDKRALEVIYLSNCQYGTASAGAQGWKLEAEYYDNTNNSQNGQVPSAADRTTEIWRQSQTLDRGRPANFAGSSAQSAAFLATQTLFNYWLASDACLFQVGRDKRQLSGGFEWPS
ncbi:hypothetical protein BJ508DRAFT_323945 [Ascobolus immersus RN42]|uniref:SCP domain-containing protein n=1 Tax=Ascobolus immersus RN42 TaxID=1160509 RepID=A0A3N4IDU2_ASCIM|nr:hypothetical protein BJ508DRAFT_323945 [Ascobolus immersus RN42]